MFNFSQNNLYCQLCMNLVKKIDHWKRKMRMLKPQNIQEVVLPLSIVSWILGTGVFEFPLGRPRLAFSFLYTLSIVSAYVASCYFTYANENYIYLKSINKTGDFIFKLLYYGNIFLTFTGIILGWNRRKGLKKCMQSIGVVDEFLHKMGITKDYDKTLLREMGCILGMTLVTIVVIIMNSFSLYYHNPPLYVKVIFISAAHFPILIIFIADMMFVCIISSMKRKFARLNALLKNMSSTTPLSPQYMKLLHRRTGLLKPTAVAFEKKTNDDTLLMKAAKQVHLDLVKISRNVNETFGLQILLSMALASVFITGLLYCSYTVIYLPTNPEVDQTPGMISGTCWLFFYVMKILIINHICDRTSAEALKTGNIICELHEPMTNKEFRSEIREFVLQLIQNPLKFTAYDFVSLDYTFIQGVVGSITTYLVILIQLGGDISESVISSNSTEEGGSSI